MRLTGEEMVAEALKITGGMRNYLLPEEAAQAQLQKMVEWGDEECTEHFKHQPKSKSQARRFEAQGLSMKRRYCPHCWQALRQEAGKEMMPRVPSPEPSPFRLHGFYQGRE